MKKKALCAILGTAILLAGANTAHAETVENCIASWYGPGFHGNRMANGQIFNQDNPAHMAHKTLPFGTVVDVTNEENGRTLRTVVTDRGPFISHRCVDMSRAGATQLGFLNAGTARVRVRVVN